MYYENGRSLTKNLFQAAFLITCGHSCEIEWSDDSRAIFVFRDKPDVRKAAEEFTDNHSVGVKSYVEAYRYLRNLMFDQKRRRIKNQ